MSEWKSFPAPQYKRVMVCGWQPESRNVTGYWWWHEDNTDGRGCAIEHGDALYWTEIVLPEFPQPPATEIAK